MQYNPHVSTTVTIYLTVILIYAVLIMSSYVILAIISLNRMMRYIKENSFVRYPALLSSEHAPAFTLIAPAYNEGPTIEENVKSLLSLNYNNYEVLVVIDGSQDSTRDFLINRYELYQLSTPYDAKIPTAEVLGIYKSANPVFKKLTVVDKVHSGKGDSLNAGLNIAQNPYVICVDVDCVLDKDALLKMAKPFLETEKKRLIAMGGVIRISNQCRIIDGRLMNIRVPDKLLPRIQVLEYLRAFLLGRMAWARLDGLLLISGAFGAFDKEIAIAAGGYDITTVGEDMELVVRMRRYMIDKKMSYTVTYIPDPLCWTEVPDKFPIFKRQRSRWMRGTMETLWKHRIMFLNPRYGRLGLISFPYWFFFEFLAPVVEFTGLIITFFLALFGLINWYIFLLLFLFVYFFAIMFNVLALYSEVRSYYKYPKVGDYVKLLAGALLEPFYFRPMSLYASLVGYMEKIRRKKSWGNMERKGFQSN